MERFAYLPERGVVEVSGEDSRTYLQGLVSNDVNVVCAGRAVWAALLTPQGRWLADFFILQDGQRLLIDCERDQLNDLIRRFERFKLRSRVSFRDVSDEFFVHVAWGAVKPDIEAPSFADPRLEHGGWRFLAQEAMTTSAAIPEWDAWRLNLGLPDGSRDLESGKTLLLEAGFDELNGISWTKGCYLGQELTARTKYRGLLKRRLVPVASDSRLPPAGTPITTSGRDVGTMRSSHEGIGLAMLRIDAIAACLIAGETPIVARIPAWMFLTT